MKVLELIDEIIAEIETSKKSLFSGKKTIDVDFVLDILDEIKEAMPEEIIYAQKIIDKENRILGQAQKNAEGIMVNARKQVSEQVEEHQVVQLAYEKANRMIEDSRKQAFELRVNSSNYAVEVLDDLMAYMGEYMDIINENKSNFISKKNKDQAEF